MRIFQQFWVTFCCLDARGVCEAGRVGRRNGEHVMHTNEPVAVDLPPGLIVVVLGPATRDLTGTLWSVGLRPVRGQRYGTVWAKPADWRQ